MADLRSRISDFLTGTALMAMPRLQAEIYNLKSAMSHRHWRSAEAT
jgi:hypothetical protein